MTRSGTQLTLDGQPYRFTGINIYNANNAGLCWYPMAGGSTLDDSLAELGGAAKVIRAWFFQSLATAGGQRDWSGFDHTLAVAAARGVKVVATLGNQWEHCDGLDGGGGSFKDESWYTTGYTQPDPAGTASYRDWVAEVVDHYKGDPTILAWQLMNEAEVKPSAASSDCSVGAATILKSFATDVSGLVKSIDGNHLVSLGTIGGGQCGAQGDEYQDLHDISTVDLCEYHDYGAPTTAMPGDQWNGLQRRLDQCNALGKPLFVGETGIRPTDVVTGSQPFDGSLLSRSVMFELKFRAQFQAGVVGEIAWAWNAQESKVDDHDIGPGDPALGTLAAWNSPASGTVTRGSLTPTGGEADNRSLRGLVSSDGRYLVFSSEAGNLTPADTHSSPGCGGPDVFLKDMQTGAIELVSVDSNEQQLGGFCGTIAEGMTPDARFIVMTTTAYRGGGSSYAGSDVVVRDRATGITENLTAGANDRSANATISRSGRYVVFMSEASNLVPGTSACGVHQRMYLYDRQTDQIELVSVGSDGTSPCGGNGSNIGVVSDDGRWVAFMTDRSLVPEDADGLYNQTLDVYLRDRQTGTTTLVSRDLTGGDAGGFFPVISGDGRYVAFDSTSGNIVSGDTNDPYGYGYSGSDVFVYDRVTDQMELVSRVGGHQLEYSQRPDISAGGRFVTFVAGHQANSSGDQSGYYDIYVHDRVSGRSERVVNNSGDPAGGAYLSALSMTGRYVVFDSSSSDWVADDTNSTGDIFVLTRTGSEDPYDAPPTWPVDSDGDGIPDSLDANPGTASDAFADAAGSSGTILDRAGLSVVIEDLPDPDGVRITVDAGAGQARVRVCGIATVRLDGGDAADVKCGSVTTTAHSGQVELDLDNNSTVTVPQGTTVTASAQVNGGYTIQNHGPAQISVTIGGVPTSVPPGQTVTTPPPNPCAGAPPAGAIVGTNGNNTLKGTSGNDVIFGLGGSDAIDGKGGDDTICAGDGTDTVSGGDGNDRIDTGAGSDRADGNTGNDTIDGQAGNDTLAGGAGDDTVNGGDGNDTVNGNDGNDTLTGGNNDDTVSGGSGSDAIDTGAGIDKAEGNAGNDAIDGQAGNDTLTGGAGDDTLDGGDGNDKLEGNDGTDTLRGGNNDDDLKGGAGTDTLDGGPGTDKLNGEAGTDTCTTGETKKSCEA